MTAHFAKLKRQLHRLDIDYGYLAEKLGRSKVYVEKIMTGRLEIRLDEAWMIFGLTGEDRAKFVEYFPMGGIGRTEERITADRLPRQSA